MIDLYCERLVPEFWAEPINALTNTSFLIAALFGWHLARQRDCLYISVKWLLFLTAAVAIGSFLFHTFATRWAMILDVTPIFLFHLLFFWLYSQKVMALKFVSSSILILVYVLATLLCSQYPGYLNGSLIYAPTLLMILSLGLYHFIQKKLKNWLLLTVFGLSVLALAFRTFDSRLCSVFSTGTHFLWHISCGIIVYLMARALIVNLPAKN